MIEHGREGTRKARGEGRYLAYLHFRRWDPARLYLKPFALPKQAHYKPALTLIWLEVRFRDAKHLGKKRVPRHQLTTERQMKMVLIMCRY